MREYITIIFFLGFGVGIVVLTHQFMSDRGMTYEDYRVWLSALLSIYSLISNAAIAYYFSSKKRTGDG
jgi:uncharacterized membrane protein